METLTSAGTVTSHQPSYTPVQYLDFDEIHKEQRRVAALLRRNVKNTVRRGKNRSKRFEPPVKFCSKLDPNGKYRDPALDFLQEGLFNVRKTTLPSKASKNAVEQESLPKLSQKQSSNDNTGIVQVEVIVKKEGPHEQRKMGSAAGKIMCVKGEAAEVHYLEGNEKTPDRYTHTKRPKKHNHQSRYKSEGQTAGDRDASSRNGNHTLGDRPRSGYDHKYPSGIRQVIYCQTKGNKQVKIIFHEPDEHGVYCTCAAEARSSEVGEVRPDGLRGGGDPMFHQGIADGDFNGRKEEQQCARGKSAGVSNVLEDTETTLYKSPLCATCGKFSRPTGRTMSESDATYTRGNIQLHSKKDGQSDWSVLSESKTPLSRNWGTPYSDFAYDSSSSSSRHSARDAPKNQAYRGPTHGGRPCSGRTRRKALPQLSKRAKVSPAAISDAKSDTAVADSLAKGLDKDKALLRQIQLNMKKHQEFLSEHPLRIGQKTSRSFSYSYFVPIPQPGLCEDCGKLHKPTKHVMKLKSTKK